MKASQAEALSKRRHDARAKRRANGLCVTCAKESRPGKGQCKECSELAKARYRVSIGKEEPAPKKKPRTQITKGVRRKRNCDGYGRVDYYYVAAIMVGGKTLSRRWSVTKHGEAGAKLAASLQKLLWVVENGLWNPDDGDPLAIMNYAASFEGNDDYENSVVFNVASSWINVYEDLARF